MFTSARNPLDSAVDQNSYCCRCRDLYLTYALMLCESFNYFSLSLLFVLYLTQEFGVGDVEVSSMPLLVIASFLQHCHS